MEKITFIAPAFHEEKYNRVLIDSLLNQSNPNWELIVYHNGQNDEMKEWVGSHNDNRIIYFESETNTGSWGCYNRIDVLNSWKLEKYVIQTSIQDYFIINAVDKILHKMQTGIDMCYWNSLHHDQDFNILDTQLKVCQIDWGNFCLLSSVAKKLSIPEPDAYTADGITVETGIAKGFIKTHEKIDKILTIKN